MKSFKQLSIEKQREVLKNIVKFTVHNIVDGTYEIYDELLRAKVDFMVQNSKDVEALHIKIIGVMGQELLKLAVESAEVMDYDEEGSVVIPKFEVDSLDEMFI